MSYKKGHYECVRDFSFNPELVFLRIDSITVHKQRSNLLESSTSPLSPSSSKYGRSSRFETIYENSRELADSDDGDTSSINSDQEHKDNCFDFVS